MFERIYLFLKKREFDVYSVGQHKGICRNPYVVIRNLGQQPFRVNFIAETYEILFYYPFGAYSEFQGYIDKVRDALTELDYLRPTGELSPFYNDDRKRAYTTGAKYRVYMRRKDNA